MIGTKVGKLTVVNTQDDGKTYTCKCECGVTTTAKRHALMTAHKKSCGCLKRSTLSNLKFKHGKSSSAIYKAWWGMISKCSSIRSKSYAAYGAQGIKVCERWQEFVNFEADMGPRPDGAILELIYRGAEFSSGNCHWVDK